MRWGGGRHRVGHFVECAFEGLDDAHDLVVGRGQGRHDHDHVAEGTQQDAAGDGAGADAAAPAQARPRWRQLHADHESPLAHFLHAGERGDPVGEERRQLIGCGR